MKKDSVSRINTLLMILIALMLALIIILIIYIGVNNKNKNNIESTPEPTPSPTFAVLVTPTPTPDTNPLATPTNTPDNFDPTQEPEKTHTPTPTPTPTPSSESTPTPTPDPDNIYYTGIDPTAGTYMDYSFLAGVSTDYFHDINIHDYYTSGKYKGKLMGSWWSGTEIKDSNGKITNIKRSAATEALLEKYNACYVDRDCGKTIYLTFDCGYENGQTAKILDTLKEKGVKAIFFVTAQFLAEDSAKELCERMIAEGHLIGNHTYSHPNMMLSSNDEFVNELAKNENRLNALLGYEYKMTFYRPPEGASSERDLALAQKLGYKTVFWSFAYGDYNPDNQMDPEKALNNYLEAKIHSGAVYLLHAVSSTNAAILGDFIEYGWENGYTFARLDTY